MGSRQFWLLLILASLAGVVFYERSNSGGTHRLGAALRSHIDSVLGRPGPPPLIEEVASIRRPTATAPVASPGAAPGIRSELGAHTANFASACSKPKTLDVADVVKKQAIYKWTDANGKTHFSDKAPKTAVRSIDRVEQNNRRQLYRLNINKVDVSLPTHFEGRMQAATNKIYEHYRDWLTDGEVRQAQISLSIYGDDQSFEAYKNKLAPSLKTVAGFYSHRHNEAVVKYREPYQATQRTAIHEIAHLVTAGHLGATAPWFTEGLSEYFEDFDIDASGARIRPHKRRLQQLQKMLDQGQLEPLGTYIKASYADFHGENQREHYMVSWSLLHYLQSNRQGQDILAELVRATRQNFCKPFNARGWLYAKYPGGYTELNSDWKRWLATSA